METEFKQLIEAQQKKIDEIYVSVEKTRKYLYWTMVGTIVFFVLPVIAAAILIPWIMNSYIETMQGLGI